ncbi:MAG TPA: hypothetical protein VKB38_23440 [Terracidiphilus sp.]|nr:hypothetical protein [Terracidiphilus sp.]
MDNVEYDKAAALKAAKKLFGENAIVWEDGDLKCVGADANIYDRKTLKTTSWKKFTFNGKVRWGSALTWEGAVKSANRTRALKAHDGATKRMGG